MRILDGEQSLVRIFLGESDRWKHRPLSRALLERLRTEGFAGATVIHGTAGFGASSVIHTASLVELSSDLPVLIEVVDVDPHIERLLPILDEMLICLTSPIPALPVALRLRYRHLGGMGALEPPRLSGRAERIAAAESRGPLRRRGRRRSKGSAP